MNADRKALAREAKDIAAAAMTALTVGAPSLALRRKLDRLIDQLAATPASEQPTVFLAHRDWTPGSASFALGWTEAQALQTIGSAEALVVELQLPAAKGVR